AIHAAAEQAGAELEKAEAQGDLTDTGAPLADLEAKDDEPDENDEAGDEFVGEASATGEHRERPAG
ncbi:hypothetical protein AB0M20_43920, partial [Actinoplanes sp. NPDC051633]|uniref:hypothetical protein n=1 Tax=Actinoplanes sp. NPDC051633 TaxID=3155670 RepID=UPI0034396E21